MVEKTNEEYQEACMDIGDYKLLKLVGKGGFGQAYQAVDGNEEFCVKLIHEK
jgi:serine/threonine protein kinase